MGFVEQFTAAAAAAAGFLESFADRKRPHEIEVKYPATSPAAGALAGRFLLKRGATGGLEYEFHDEPEAFTPEKALAELVIGHKFMDLSSLAEWLTEASNKESAFLTAERFKTTTLSVAIHADRPEEGLVYLPVERHPIWLRWFGVLGTGPQARDLDHVTFADLLIDNREDLVQPQVASMIASFRSARTIRYAADLDNMQSFGIAVEWKGASSDDPKKSTTQVPRDFEVKLPVWAGVYPEGEEPKYTLKVRVRVVAPKGDADAAPMFRVLPLNAIDIEAKALSDLDEHASGALGRTVYVGERKVETFIVPGLAPAK